MDYQISQLELFYFISWVSLCFISITLVALNKKEYEFLTKGYLKFLSEPWKLVTFAIAMIIIIVAAPYSGDHTWDTPDSILCSVLTFYFCPWAMGIFYRFMKYPIGYTKLLVAFCAFWLPCWAYDGYIFFRDQAYPATSWPNLFISGGICFAAGLFWNLAWTTEQGGYFAFYKAQWPNIAPTPFLKIFIYALILMIPIALSVGWFLWHYFYGFNF